MKRRDSRPEARIAVEQANLQPSLRVAEVVAALSQALDLGAGSTPWHSVRTCIIGMRIAAELNLSEDTQEDLFYALLLKDSGCCSGDAEIYQALGFQAASASPERPPFGHRLSRRALEYALAHTETDKSFAERAHAILRVASEHTERAVPSGIPRDRGLTLARVMGLTDSTATGIASLTEHWDGTGYPDRLSRQQIPVISRIALLAGKLDVFLRTVGDEAAIRIMGERSARWFDPDAVSAARSLAHRGALWSDLDGNGLCKMAVRLEPKPKTVSEGPMTLDAICRSFAAIVDAKSPFTYSHSNGVANAAVAIAKQLDLPHSRILLLRHAALLHDVGKMAVSNAVLQKNGTLDPAEWREIHSHPEHTWNILNCIRGFEEIREIAACHHERLDGSGYFRNLTGAQLSVESRILAVADIFDALSNQRPYRGALPLEEVFQIIRRSTPHQLDARCVEALEQSGLASDQRFRDLQILQEHLKQTDASSRDAARPSDSHLKPEHS